MAIDVIDSLDSTDEYSALSANQGRVLCNMINDLMTGALDEDGNLIITLNERIFQNDSL
jgi:hypothetical protein